jgi:hypothetical protein
MGLNISNNQNPLEKRRTPQKIIIIIIIIINTPFLLYDSFGMKWVWIFQIIKSFGYWKKGPITCCKHTKKKKGESEHLAYYHLYVLVSFLCQKISTILQKMQSIFHLKLGNSCRPSYFLTFIPLWYTSQHHNWSITSNWFSIWRNTSNPLQLTYYKWSIFDMVVWTNLMFYKFSLFLFFIPLYI